MADEPDGPKNGSIVSMRGTGAPPGQPDPTVIAQLEHLLARARAGEIIAIAIGTDLTMNRVERWAWWQATHDYRLLGILDYVKHDILAMIFKTERPL